MNGEEWLPVELPGPRGGLRRWPYEVSNLGRVRRAGPRRQGTRPGRLLRPWWGGGGGGLEYGDGGGPYLYVTLTDRGDRTDRLVHRVVARMWLGPPPSRGAQVDHLEPDRENNAASNLEWVSADENLRRQWDVPAGWVR